MKKVIIIGAGIAGLTCGVYCRKNGFDTEIYELHSIPGGECTGWDRSSYHFDGCLHWLVGSKEGTSLNQVWRDTGALDDSVKIINNEIFCRFEEDGKAVNFYTDAEKLKKHLTEIAPEDKKEIDNLYKAIKKLGKFGMPLDKPMDMMKMSDGIKFMAKNFSSLSYLSKYSSLSIKEYSKLFKNPLLKRAILATIPGDYTCMALISTLGGMDDGDCGFPEGGSRKLAKRMGKKFVDLGGKVFYKSKVDKIIVEDSIAKGIKFSDGKTAYADYIVSCADGYATLKHMLDDKYTPDMYNELFNNPKVHPAVTSSLVFMGVNAEIPFDFRSTTIKREAPVELNGVMCDDVNILHYGFDKTMQQEGKTVFACFYRADFDYWNNIYQHKEKYKEEKKKLENDAVAWLIKRYPQVEAKIEVTDVATPMTYVRYCNAWRGSWMTWTNPDKAVPRYFPGLLPGLQNFIMAGMWTLPPGGMPGAGGAGKFAAQRICIENGIKCE